jgi:putative ABC transport system permease protein
MRRARIEFGGVDATREDARAARGLRVFDQLRFSWLDLKLGVRMLRKYPGLSTVSIIGMSVAIAIGAGGFQFISSMMRGALPLPGGDRVVMLQNNTPNIGNPDRRATFDFLVWRRELRSVRDVSAFRDENRNLVTASAEVRLVSVADMSASGFRVAHGRPLMGRPLLDQDEQPGAPLVVVIGHDAWQRHFGGDPAILGRAVRIGIELHTVVGVMPPGFNFPISHDYWTPLRLEAAPAPGEGRDLYVFGRLADRATRSQAQAELTTIGRRMAAAHPRTHAELRPQVQRFTHAIMDFDTPGMALLMRGFQLALSLLLVVVAVNVAVVVYARTAARTGEIAVRAALGASRRRIVTQLFAEGLVVSTLSAVMGLLMAGVAVRLVDRMFARTSDDALPYWIDLSLSPATVVYTAGLAVLAAAIVGVVPALKATGRGLDQGLKQLSARGSRMHLGRTWSAMIVAQVAIAVALLPFAAFVAGNSLQRGLARPGYAVDRILLAYLSLEQRSAIPPTDTAARETEEARFLGRVRSLISRVAAEPGVAGVTHASGLPGIERYGQVEVEGRNNPIGLRVARIEAGYFEDMGVSVLAGRPFSGADSLRDANTVIVDRAFAEQVLGGGPVLGRRIRQIRFTKVGGRSVREPGPWLEIVGLVPNFAVQPDFDPLDPRVYVAEPLTSESAATLSIRLAPGVSPQRFAARLRELTATVDADLRLHALRTAAEHERQRSLGLLGITVMVGAVIASVVLLSAAGVYAMMSFLVVRRKREIGIRIALGAGRRRVLTGVFATAGRQLGVGCAVGVAVAAILGRVVSDAPFSGGGLAVLALSMTVMAAVGLLATLGPARRVLAMQPTDALREE